MEEVIVLLTTDPLVMKKKAEDVATANPSTAPAKGSVAKSPNGKTGARAGCKEQGKPSMNGTFDLRSGETTSKCTSSAWNDPLRYDFCADCSGIFAGLFPKVATVDLPLLLTVYFGLSRRNPSTGLLLGMVIGLLQDSLSKTPLGLFGIAKTLIGFVASSIGGKLDTEHPRRALRPNLRLLRVAQGNRRAHSTASARASL